MSNLSERLSQFSLSEIAKRRLIMGGYVLYTLIAVIIFVRAELPRREMAAAVTSKLSAATGYYVTAEEFSLRGLSGVVLDDLTVEFSPERRVSIDRQIVQVKVLAYLFGNLRAKAESRVGSGIARLTLNHVDEAIDAELDMANLALGSFFPESPDQGFGLFGTAEGRMTFSEPEVSQLNANAILSGIGKATGEVQLTATDGKLQGISARGFPLPTINFDRLELSAKLVNGQIQLSRAVLSGPDADIELLGTIAIDNPFSRSRLNLRVKLDPKGEFRDSYGPLLPTRFRREPDGSFSVELQGTPSSPILRK